MPSILGFRASIAQQTQPLSNQPRQSLLQRIRSRLKRGRRQRSDDLESATSYAGGSSTQLSDLPPSTLQSTENRTPSTLPTTVSTDAEQPEDLSANPTYHSYSGLMIYKNEGSISQELEDEWNGEISGRLWHIFRSKEISCSASLCMAATRKGEEPKATIVFTCSDGSMVQHAENTITHEDWLMTFVSKRALRVKYAIAQCAYQSAVKVDHSLQTTSFPGMCSMRIPNNLQSICGLQIEIRPHNGLSSKQCTIGGLVRCEEKLYAWLVKHIFEDELSGKSLLLSSSTRLRKGVPSVKRVVAASMTMPSWRKVTFRSKPTSMLGRVETKSIELDSAQIITTAEQTRHRVDYDWALLKLESLSTDTQKRLCLPNKVGSRSITGTQSLDRCSGGQVAIITPGGTAVQGSMSRFNEILSAGSSTYCARKITLDRPLPRGCSGSWVVQDSYVIGYIVAVRKELPWVYMLSMEEALQDIEQQLGSSVSIAVFHKENTIPSKWVSTDPQNIATYEPEPESQHKSLLTQPLLNSTETTTSTRPISYDSGSSKSTGHQILSSMPSLVNTTTNLSSGITLYHNWRDSYSYSSLASIPLDSVICRIVANHNGDRYSEERKVRFAWLQNQSTFKEAMEWSLKLTRDHVSKSLIYLRSVTCAMKLYDGHCPFGKQSIEDENQWTTTISVMILDFRGRNDKADFLIELEFSYGSLSGTPNLGIASLSILKEHIAAKMCENMYGRQYMPRQALNAIMTHGEVERFMTSLICRTCSVPTAASRHFLRRSRKLLAIIVYADVPLQVLKFFYDRRYNDSILPLSFNILDDLDQRDSKLISGLKTIQHLQWPFLSPLFDREVREVSTVLSSAKHSVLPKEMPLPIIGDQARSCLPRGSFGTVYKVTIDMEHHNLSPERNSVFALKVIPYRSKNGEAIDAEKQILKAMSELSHEHVAAHLASWTQSGSLHLLYRYATQNLRSYMDETTQPTLAKESTLWLFSQLTGMSDALRVIHNLDTFGIDDYGTTPIATVSRTGYVGCHHNIKPQNVLVFERGPTPTFKISDFGLTKINQLHADACAEPESEKERAALDRYSAPELHTRGHAGRPYDIWSLGCVFLEILVWVASGNQVLDRKKFPEHNTPGRDCGYFWTMENSKPVLHPATSDALQFLHQWSLLRGVFKRTTQLIEQMLRVVPEKRPWASTVANNLDAIIKQAKIDLQDDEFYLHADNYASRRNSSARSISSAPSLALMEPRSKPYTPLRKSQKWSKSSTTLSLRDPELTREQRRHQALGTTSYDLFGEMDHPRFDDDFSRMLDHPQFNNWLRNPNPSLLWITGKAGAGKSTLCRYLINPVLSKEMQKTCCYFFFNLKGDEKQDKVFTALSALIRQLCNQEPRLAHSAIPECEKTGDSLVRSNRALWQILLDSTKIRTSQPVVFVLDGLDECATGDREELVELLCNWQISGGYNSSRPALKILVTSRPHDELQALFGPIVKLWPEIHLRGESTKEVTQQGIVTTVNPERGTMLGIGSRFEELYNRPMPDWLTLRGIRDDHTPA